MQNKVVIMRRAKRRAMLQRATQMGNTQQQEDDVYDVEDAEGCHFELEPFPPLLHANSFHFIMFPTDY
jgi:hypothetical protein